MSVLAPLIVWFIMKKAYGFLGIGNLMNPMTAMSLATGGGGKVAAGGGSSLSAKLRNTSSSVLNKADRAAKWGAGNSTSRRLVGKGGRGAMRLLRSADRVASQSPGVAGLPGAKTLAATATNLARKEKREALLSKAKTQALAGASKLNPLAAGAAARNRLNAGLATAKTDYKAGAALGAAQGAGKLGTAYRGISTMVGAKVDEGAAARGKALTAGSHMLSVLASAGVVVAGEGRPDLAKALASWGQELSPDAPKAINRRYERELRTRTAHVHDDEEASKIAGELGGERQRALAGALLGPEFNPAGVLSPRSIGYLADAYAEQHNVSRDHVTVDPTTGFTFLSPAGANRIPMTNNASVLEAYARSPLTWMEPEVTDFRPGETQVEHAVRMRALLDRSGYLDAETGAVVDMLAVLDLEPGPELHAELRALASGAKTDLRDYIGVANPSEQALRDVAANVKHNFVDVDSDNRRHAVTVQLRQELSELKAEEIHVSAAIDTARTMASRLGSEVSATSTPLELRAVTDRLTDELQTALVDAMGSINDQLVTVYSANAAAGAEPSEIMAMTPNLDKFSDELGDKVREALEDVGDRLNSVRTAPSPTDAAREAARVAEWIEHELVEAFDKVKDELESTDSRLADQLDRNAQMSNTYGNGVSRAGDYSNGSEPPLRLVS